MRLTVEEHREAIKRYRHIKRASGRRATLCSTRYPGGERTCTRVKGHSGPHVAHTFLRRVVAVWDSGPGARASGPTMRRDTQPTARSGLPLRRPVGLRTRSPVGVLEGLRGLFVRAVSSVEEISFILLFLVFVVLAIEVLLSLH